MNSKTRLDILLLSQDLAVGTTLARAFHAQFNHALVKPFSSVAEAVNSHRIAWFDLIVVHDVQLSDCDCWRFLSMIRSGDFGFRDTPAFIVVSPEQRDAFAPLCDARTTLVAADSPQEAVQQIAMLRDSVRLPTVLVIQAINALRSGKGLKELDL